MDETRSKPRIYFQHDKTHAIAVVTFGYYRQTSFCYNRKTKFLSGLYYKKISLKQAKRTSRKSKKAPSAVHVSNKGKFENMTMSK